METIRKFKNVKDTDLIISEPIKETEKAIFATVLNLAGKYNNDFWIPKSVISYIEDYVVIPAWFINKNFTKII